LGGRTGGRHVRVERKRRIVEAARERKTEGLVSRFSAFVKSLVAVEDEDLPHLVEAREKEDGRVRGGCQVIRRSGRGGLSPSRRCLWCLLRPSRRRLTSLRIVRARRRAR